MLARSSVIYVHGMHKTGARGLPRDQRASRPLCGRGKEAHCAKRVRCACERAPGDSPVHSAVYRSELLAGLRCLPPSMLKALFRHSDERHASMLRMPHAGAFARSAGISTIELLQQQSATFHGDSIFKILWIAWLYSDSNCLETPALAQS